MNNTDDFFDLKLQLTNEYLRNGGMEGICDIDLLQDLIDFDRYDVKTHTSQLKAFINGIFMINMTPPPVSHYNISEYKSFLQKDFFSTKQKLKQKSR